MKKLRYYCFVAAAELITLVEAWGYGLSFYAKRLLYEYQTSAAILLAALPVLLIGGLLWAATYTCQGFGKREKLFLFVILLLNAGVICAVFCVPFQVTSLDMICLMGGYSLAAMVTPMKRKRDNQ